MLPSLFLSHGSPMLAIEDAPARDFLKTLPGLLPKKPTAILVASAHWERKGVAVSAPAANRTIYDFGGFPEPLYRLTYPAPPAPALANRVAELTGASIDTIRGLDHGAWVPLLLAFPEADIPVAQVSIQTLDGPQAAFDLGRKLAPLRDEGVLVVGSGSFTHNLGEFRSSGGQLDAPEQAWVHDFAEWMRDAISTGRESDLIAYRAHAPHAVRNHPTEEHLLPLHVALGAGGGGQPRTLHSSTTYGILRMDAFSFG